MHFLIYNCDYISQIQIRRTEHLIQKKILSLLLD